MERTQVTPLKLAVIASGRRQKDIAAALLMTEAQFSLIVNGKHASERIRAQIADELGQKVEMLFPPSAPLSPFGEAA
jgi:ribosomal protein S9